MYRRPPKDKTQDFVQLIKNKEEKKLLRRAGIHAFEQPTSQVDTHLTRRTYRNYGRKTLSRASIFDWKTTTPLTEERKSNIRKPSTPRRVIRDFRKAHHIVATEIKPKMKKAPTVVSYNQKMRSMEAQELLLDRLSRKNGQ